MMRLDSSDNSRAYVLSYSGRSDGLNVAKSNIVPALHPSHPYSVLL